MKPQASAKTRESLLLPFGLIAAAMGLVFVAKATFEDSLKPPPTSVQPAAAQVSGEGITLSSQRVDLPDDSDAYPPGPGSDVMNGNCTACHSASMALVQPRLSAADWKGEVQKMRDTYKAQVADQDVPAIVDYLTRLSQRLPAPVSSLGAASTGAADTAG